MATMIIKRRNFKAPLPDDFYILKSLTRLDNSERLAYTKFPHGYDPYLEYFTMHEDYFYFTGYWSKWLLVKWYQKLKECIWPVKYKVEYFSINEYNQLKNK